MTHGAASNAERERAWTAACKAWSADNLDQIEETMRLGEVMMYAATDLISALEARALAAEARVERMRGVMEPFIALAKAVTDEGSPDFRSWIGEAQDSMAVFGFAGYTVTLGQLRALAQEDQTADQPKADEP